ncbi:L-2,4-diaminobutyrate decarboxylase [Actinomadura cremea]|nr:L-2,4-diaminobutyrate decarboxylase [Actinomadura cremea]
MTDAPPPGRSGSRPLTLPGDVMRDAGRHVIDMICAHLREGAADPVTARLPPETAKELRAQPVPLAPADPLQVLGELGPLLRSGNTHPDHPRFLGFVPSPGNYMGVLAAALAAGFAVPTGWSFSGPVSTAIEKTTIAWLVELLGLPPETGGLFVSGGSTATLHALTVARDTTAGSRHDRATAYCSDQTHFSVDRALHVLGISRDRVRHLPTGTDGRLDVRQVEELVRADRRAGLQPFAVIANAGTTGTGAVDPLEDLSALCSRNRLWLHVDGAFGAAAAITEEGRCAVPGLPLADSLTLDPHKWLFQPAELGCVLLRRPELLRESFGVSRPSYLSGAGGADDGDLMQYGIQQTREFRALKLWLSLKVFGAQAFRGAVAAGMRLAEDIGKIIAARDDLELTTAPSLGVLTFRPAPPALALVARDQADTIIDRAVGEIAERLADSGDALVMPTLVADRRVLRLCTINPRADVRELEAVVDGIAVLADELITGVLTEPGRTP